MRETCKKPEIEYCPYRLFDIPIQQEKLTAKCAASPCNYLLEQQIEQLIAAVAEIKTLLPKG